MTLTELANDLKTTIYVLMAFAAPGDIPADMDPDAQVPADVEESIRDNWVTDDGPDANG